MVASNYSLILQLLRGYAGSRLAQKRIIVLSDGEDGGGLIDSVLPGIISDEIVIDSIIYG